MKRKCLMLCGVILLFILAFTGCAGSTHSSTAQKQTSKQNHASGQKQTSSKNDTSDKTKNHSWQYLTQNYQVTSYDKIKSGSYPGQYVIVSCVVENVEFYNFSDRIECDVWFKSNDSFLCDNISFNGDELDGYDPKSLMSGDNIKICVYVERDNSFGSTIIGFSKEENFITLSDIHNTFKENCKSFDYEQVQSNPKALRGTTYILSGITKQIVTEDTSHIEFILSTVNDEFVYIYYKKPNKGFVLPQGSFKIYGTFYLLKNVDYYKNIPSISAEFIESSTQPTTPAETQENPTTVQETTTEVTTVAPTLEETKPIPTVPPAPVEITEAPTTPVPPVQEVTYILNTNTMKIHVPSCSSVDKISSKNYATTTLSIPELEEEGYSRCGRCLK